MFLVIIIFFHFDVFSFYGFRSAKSVPKLFVLPKWQTIVAKGQKNLEG
jgi:hypothetical protein